MKLPNEIFISWSGERSRRVAAQLKSWLPLVIDVPKLWLSSQDLSGGSRWSTLLAERLQACNFGIMVVTSENQYSPWLVFEAGALSKNLNEGRVLPYLIDLKLEELDGPLAQFQGHSADKEGTLHLIRAINAVIPSSIDEKIFSKRFEKFWPELKSVLDDVAASATEKTIEKDKGFTPKVENEELSRLRAEFSTVSEMLKQLVQTLAPSELVTDSHKDSKDSTQSITDLEGAWFNPESKTHVYIESINGKLYAPYCFGGDDELIGLYYDLQIVGDHIFGRFKWLNGLIRGSGFFRRISPDLLDGFWWMEEGNSEGIPNIEDFEGRGDGVPEKLQRLPGRKSPKWAEQYFSSIAKKTDKS